MLKKTTMYLPKKVFKTFFFMLIISAGTVAAHAQSFDYKSRPVLNFAFTKAEINLKLNPQKVSLNGSVLYHLKANISGADTLTLNAPGITVDSVRSPDRHLYFSTNDSLLKIALSSSSQRGHTYQVEIFYRAAPRFGLLKSSEGTVWTSMLPRSTRHWLPTKDNPRVQMKATLSLRIPADYKAFASGVSKGKKMFPDSTKKLTFLVDQPVPITALSFGVGHFQGINSFVEPNSISAKKRSELVDTVKQMLTHIKKATGEGYPYQRLNLVVLNDDHWEEKSYGVSTVILYKNRGDWMGQLRRGLYAQWFGVYKHAAQWAQAWPINFMQAILYNQLTDSTTSLKVKGDEPRPSFSTVYGHFSAKNWNMWQQYASQNMPNTKAIAVDLMPVLLNEEAGTVTDNSFREAWYTLSGQPHITLPSIQLKTKADTAEVVSDSIHYRVDYIMPQSSDTLHTLQLVFKAQKQGVQQSVKLPAQIITSTETHRRRISFSDTVDTVSLPIPNGTKNVRLKVPEGKKLVLDQHKPVPFLLYQLRNAKSSGARIEAARQLGGHTNDPDLQLALVNLMKKDIKPKVKAALLKSYGEITAGAEGTQQRFLDALKSDDVAIQRSGLEGLKHYDEQSVTKRLQTFSEDEPDTALANKALRMYLQRIDSTEALDFTKNLIQQDTSGTRAIVAIGALVERGSTKQADKYADFYIKPYYAYPVRKQALKVLIKHDTLTADWGKRLKTLMTDLDPRIRYLTVKNLPAISGVDAGAVLKKYKPKEYDARVYQEMTAVSREP
jgi:hypothetical protein